MPARCMCLALEKTDVPDCDSLHKLRLVWVDWDSWSNKEGRHTRLENNGVVHQPKHTMKRFAVANDCEFGFVKVLVRTIGVSMVRGSIRLASRQRLTDWGGCASSAW